ncbi:hypothetical protein SAMN05878281_1723 [Salegentibacter salegens]|uniref:Uncharacterized protein n=1 Tax=Salegentibacter salegens TaxID=143223 RepID=A0A1M7L4J3_9FLAO|nr:hypothetical protein SAMN05878281_1723 [Salegentibacter salegens]
MLFFYPKKLKKLEVEDLRFRESFQIDDDNHFLEDAKF